MPLKRGEATHSHLTVALVIRQGEALQCGEETLVWPPVCTCEHVCAMGAPVYRAAYDITLQSPGAERVVALGLRCDVFPGAGTVCGPGTVHGG